MHDNHSSVGNQVLFCERDKNDHAHLYYYFQSIEAYGPHVTCQTLTHRMVEFR